MALKKNNGITLEYVELMIERVKGRAHDPVARRFYETFLNIGKDLGEVKTVDDVRKILQEAYWIEEEDVRQVCYMWMYCFNHNIIWFQAQQYLWLYLCKWVLRQKVFQLHTDWAEDYLESFETTYELPPPQPDARIICNRHPFFNLKDLSLYHRYMLYCFSQGYSTEDIAQLTSQQYHWVYDEVVRLKKLMENKYGDFQ
jgi:hypothetical protein